MGPDLWPRLVERVFFDPAANVESILHHAWGLEAPIPKGTAALRFPSPDPFFERRLSWPTNLCSQA